MSIVVVELKYTGARVKWSPPLSFHGRLPSSSHMTHAEHFPIRFLSPLLLANDIATVNHIVSVG